MNPWASRRASRFRFTFPAVLAAAAVLAIMNWQDRNDDNRAASGTVIIDAPDQSLLLAATTQAQARKALSPPNITAAYVMRAYPVLSDVTILCSAGQCTLSGLVLPLTRQVDLDQRQEMLLGGLAQRLSERGYRMIVPFRMDEIDDNKFRIEAALVQENGAL